MEAWRRFDWGILKIFKRHGHIEVYRTKTNWHPSPAAPQMKLLHWKNTWLCERTWLKYKVADQADWGGRKSINKSSWGWKSWRWRRKDGSDSRLACAHELGNFCLTILSCKFHEPWLGGKLEIDLLTWVRVRYRVPKNTIKDNGSIIVEPDLNVKSSATAGERRRLLLSARPNQRRNEREMERIGNTRLCGERHVAYTLVGPRQALSAIAIVSPAAPFCMVQTTYSSWMRAECQWKAQQICDHRESVRNKACFHITNIWWSAQT